MQETLKGGQPPVDGKDKSKPKGKVEGQIDTKIEQISEADRYKNAISTLLSNGNGLTQNQLNTTLIRDRVMSTDGTISKQARKVSDKENRTMLKRSLKKQIADVVDKCSQDDVAKTEKVVSREEKLKQAEAATAGLDSISRDAVLNSLFVITGMEENIKALNTYGEDTLVEASKFKKPTSKTHAKHLKALLDVSDAELAMKKVQREALTGTEGDTTKKINIQKEIDKATKKLEVAKEVSARTGPVQDVRKATTDVLSILRQKRY